MKRYFDMALVESFLVATIANCWKIAKINTFF